MITPEKRKEYQARANAKRREQYKNPEIRQKRLDYNKTHPPLDKDYSKKKFKQYCENNPEKIEQYAHARKVENDITAEIAISKGNHGKQWSYYEELVCEVMFFSGKSFKEISEKLGRSIKSIDNRVQKIKRDMEVDKY